MQLSTKLVWKFKSWESLEPCEGDWRGEGMISWEQCPGVCVYEMDKNSSRELINIKQIKLTVRILWICISLINRNGTSTIPIRLSFSSVFREDLDLLVCLIWWHIPGLAPSLISWQETRHIKCGEERYQCVSAASIWQCKPHDISARYERPIKVWNYERQHDRRADKEHGQGEPDSGL